MNEREELFNQLKEQISTLSKEEVEKVSEYVNKLKGDY